MKRRPTAYVPAAAHGTRANRNKARRRERAAVEAARAAV
jgi:hypothetical protein